METLGESMSMMSVMSGTLKSFGNSEDLEIVKPGVPCSHLFKKKLAMSGRY